MLLKQPESNKLDHVNSGYQTMSVNLSTRAANAMLTALYLSFVTVIAVIVGFLAFYLMTLNLLIGIGLLTLNLIILSWFIALALAQSKVIELADVVGQKVSLGLVLAQAFRRSLVMWQVMLVRLEPTHWVPKYSLAPFIVMDMHLSPRQSLRLSTRLTEGRGFGKQYATVVAESLALQTLTKSGTISSSAAANTLASKYIEYKISAMTKQAEQ